MKSYTFIAPVMRELGSDWPTFEEELYSFFEYNDNLKSEDLIELKVVPLNDKIVLCVIIFNDINESY